MTDFTKLADVESVEEPADGTNVLIEENGVIKKAPKTAVGGSGKLVVKITESVFVDDWKETGHSGYDLTDILTYEEAKNAILTGGLLLYGVEEDTPMGAITFTENFDACLMLDSAKAIQNPDVGWLFFAESDAELVVNFG